MRKRESETYLRDARERLTAGWEHDRENRADGFLDLKMLAGDQWPEVARMQREAESRPCVSINTLTQFVHQVANDIRLNPPGIKVVPGDGTGDSDTAKIYSGLIREIEYESHASDIYAQAGGHAVGCGIGHFRITTDYESDDVFDQCIGIKRMPFPLSVIWDPESIQPDRSDAKFCFVTEMVHKRSWEKRFPGTRPSSVDLPTTEHDPESGLFWRNGDMYRIAEYWYKVPVKRRLVMVDGGAVYDVTDIKKSEVGAFLAASQLPPIVAEREAESFRVEQSLISGNEVLKEPTKWAGKYIPIVPVLGGEIPLETKIVRYGLVRFARDAQQLYNYARTAAAEVLGQAPKSPYLVTTKHIARYKSLWDTHNMTSRPYLPYDPDPDAPAGPTRLQQPEYPQCFLTEAELSSQDMKRATGIYEASLGAKSNETSGIAIQRREAQGDTATAHYTSNLNISLMYAGKVLVDLIPRTYDTTRVLRVLSEDEKEEFQPINVPTISDNGEPILLHDLSKGRYAARLRIGPSYATKRMEAAESMFAFVQAVPQAAAVIGDLIASNMDWPGADQIAERLKRTIPPQILDENGGQTPEQMQQAKQAEQVMQMAAQLDMLLKKAQTEKTQADAEKSRASATADNVDTVIKLIQAHMQGFQPENQQIPANVGGTGGAGGQKQPAEPAPRPNSLPLPDSPMNGGPSLPQFVAPPRAMPIPDGARSLIVGEPQPEFEGFPE